MRLDQHLFAQGLTESREKARARIMAGDVYLNGQKATKPGTPVPEGALVELRGDENPYVSRGGYKLAKAIEVFDIGLSGLACMDIGASSGGFTDCMLQNGAACVYAIDVGYGQLDWKLRQDPRVVVMERTNIRGVTKEQISHPIEFFTADVSFISLRHIFPVAAHIVQPGAAGVCLIKPQFEAGKDKVGKNGVVRDTQVHEQVIQSVLEYAQQNSFSPQGLDFSPIKGPKGNIEFLLHVKQGVSQGTLSQQQVQEAVRKAHTPEQVGD